MSRLEQMLKYIRRHKYSNDLHSFKANICGGVVFVSYENDAWNITTLVDVDGQQARFDFVFTDVDECAEHLKELYIKLETIEI